MFFVCDGCNETLKKNQVDKHAGRCSKCYSVTCVDCNQTFPGDEYVTHVTCVTEAEKYQKSLYQQKKSNKLNPQELWGLTIQEAIRNIHQAASNIQQPLIQISQCGNIPRNKNKFINFAKNSLRINSIPILESIWNFLESFKVIPNSTTAAAAGEASAGEASGGSSTGRVSTEASGGVSTSAAGASVEGSGEGGSGDDSSSKKKKKKKKTSETEPEVVPVIAPMEPSQEEIETPKEVKEKKKKKKKVEQEEQKQETVVTGEVEEVSSSQKKKKRKLEKSVEEEEEEGTKEKTAEGKDNKKSKKKRSKGE